jgi:hypothetical protein
MTKRPHGTNLVQNLFYPKDERAILCAPFPLNQNTIHSFNIDSGFSARFSYSFRSSLPRSFHRKTHKRTPPKKTWKFRKSKSLIHNLDRYSLHHLHPPTIRSLPLWNPGSLFSGLPAEFFLKYKSCHPLATHQASETIEFSLYAPFSSQKLHTLELWLSLFAILTVYHI